MLCGGALFAQSKINEGSITYQVDFELPEQMKAFGANFPKEIKIYFKGDTSNMRTETPMFKSTTILNAKKEYERMLVDIPMMGKKFSIILTPADQENMQDKMPQLTLKAGTETKLVLGYKALKYEATEAKSQKNYTIWITKDVDLVQNPMTRFYDHSLGFPLEFTTFGMNGVLIKATVKELKAETVPAGSFSATKEYEEITFDQFMQMMQRR